ncbi:hypothetical protein J4032_32715 [Streptomyces formicae]|uniref:Uncharacterized protein n=1 Tax=Streptomyces formicae TaxID=1616117 RepID=A0ABY3WYH5_9ACTN|nr:hypothetical protein J4032_32715 [Streptomyces formicae]
MTAFPVARSTVERGGAPSVSSSRRTSADCRSFSSACLPGEKLACSCSNPVADTWP